ncbi:MAG: polyphosphate kinase 2 family protein [Cytophagaceae bacterium]|jgi:PPK2 family polyphosphate:nucleotide phosphotransferase|nr:polyphosphate kinase 2 family protein [Cytophagaceae bacterium]
MIHIDKLINFKKYHVKPGKKVSTKDFDTGYDGKEITKAEAEELLEEGRNLLAEIQDKLYAHNQYRILIVFQAMDAAGKDGAIKHIMSGFNPQGVKVHSFKAPTAQELDHDYFWRHYTALPGRGEIGIFNRSHYENVLVTKVHPEWILNERLPEVKSVKDVNDKFWQERYKQINRFEKNLADNGTIILKFFLHVSKKEQKKRFMERIDDPAKNWKFSLSDLKERAFWDQYQKAYGDALSATSTDYAPWYVIPADDKWFSRLAIAGIIYKEFEKLKLSYPVVNATQKAELQKAKEILNNEEGSKKPKKSKK